MGKVPTLMDLINQDLQKYVGRQIEVNPAHRGVIAEIGVDEDDALNIKIRRPDGEMVEGDYASETYAGKYIAITKLAGKLNE